MNAVMSMERESSGVCPSCQEPVALWADGCPCRSVEAAESLAGEKENRAIRRMVRGQLAAEALFDLKRLAEYEVCL